MKTKIIKLGIITAILLQSGLLVAQDSAAKGILTVSTDLVNRFVWRGLEVGGGNSPHIQPFISYANSGFEIGAWGTVGLANSYEEVDIYAKYSIAGFALTFTNYYNPQSAAGTATSANPKFYNFNGKTTASVGEVALSYKGPESLPISFTVGTFVFGNDHYYGYNASKDANGDIYYSTYLEAGYSTKLAQQPIDLFAGVTPSEGFYGTGFGLVNLGLKTYKSIKLTESYSLPTYVSLATNPQAQKVYFVVGVTL